MIRYVAALSILFLLPWTAGAEVSTEDLIDGIKHCASSSDELSLRILGRQALKRKLQFSEWSQIRQLLHQHPAAGWDLILAWDRMDFQDRARLSQAELDNQFAAGDRAMMAGDFAKASALYSALKEAIESRGQVKFKMPNFFLHQSVMHALARAQFGAGNFPSAFKTYQGISLLYPFVRQVQFEKMWAAFRANDYSQTLGAIASQLSSYFGTRLEPETYLVQYYLYRRLCRKSDIKQVVASIRSYKKALDKKQVSLEAWARRDFDSALLMRLTRSAADDSSTSLVSTADRKREMASIRKGLRQRYAQDLVRLQRQMDKVSAYLSLAPTVAKSDLPTIPKQDDLESSLNREAEMWPVEDAEDWLDEMGHHRFIGQSECE